MLSIQLLGTPQIMRDGQALTILRRKSRALLYYLAAHPGPLVREQLQALLWPEHSRAAAQQALRTALYGLRKELGAALYVTDETLALAAEANIDVRSFERRLSPPAEDSAELALALGLYRGEFLAGFSVPDAEGYDAWAGARRERYRQLAERGFVTLAQRYETQRDYAAARDALAPALALNPLQEDAQRAAMRLDYLSGDRAGAIRRYEQLRRLLDDELGVPPMDETRALYDAIITDNGAWLREAAPVAALPRTQLRAPAAFFILPPATLPFIGRDAELQKLREATAAHQLALIEGEPGIGKTRLAAAFLSDFAGLVLIGAARELEQALPYQPVIEALRGLLQRPEWPALAGELALPPIWHNELTRLLPELHADSDHSVIDTVVPGGNESRLWESVNQLLLALARHQPVAFLLDDIHWSDASTLALLGYLVRQSTSMPIAFLATSRPTTPRSPLAALLQTLTREDRLVRLPLSRLGQSDTLALARHFSALYAYPLAEWLARNADGNPYILTELVRYARDHGIVLANGTVNLGALSDAPVVPRSVYSLIQSRLAGISESARRVLDVAVAIGREFDLDVAAQAAGLPELAVLDALDELRASRLIVPLDGLRYGFDHPLTMEVAYREVGEARHRLIHRNVAEAFEHAHRDELDSYAGLIASHYTEGNAADRAAHYALMAGQHASDLAAWTEAIAFYRQALAGADDARRLQIYLGLGTAYNFAGAPAQAAEVLGSAVALAEARGDPDTADQARLILTRALITQARYAETIAIAQQVLARGAPAHAVSAELAWATALSIEGVDLPGAALHLEHAATIDAAKSNPAHLAHIKFELGGIAAQRGDLHAAVAYYHEALTIARETPDAIQYHILALNNLGYHLLLLGDPSAQEYATAGLKLAREYGLLGFQVYLLSTLGEIALARGDMAEAERMCNEGLDLAERLNIRERIAGLTANLGQIALRQGRSSLAIHRLSTALAQADALGTHHLAALIRIWLAPQLPPAERHAALAEARAIAESGGRARLLDEIARLEAQP